MRKRWIQGFGGKPERKSHLEDTDVDRNNIKTDIQQIGWAGLDWIDVAVVREKWQTVVNKVTNLLVTERANNLDLPRQHMLLTFQEELFSAELSVEHLQCLSRVTKFRSVDRHQHFGEHRCL